MFAIGINSASGYVNIILYALQRRRHFRNSDGTELCDQQKVGELDEKLDLCGKRCILYAVFLIESVSHFEGNFVHSLYTLNVFCDID